MRHQYYVIKFSLQVIFVRFWSIFTFAQLVPVYPGQCTKRAAMQRKQHYIHESLLLSEYLDV